MRARLRRPSPALVVACLALVVAMSGTTWAVTTLPASSVGSTQLRTGAVTNTKIGSRAVSNTKLKAYSVTSTKIATNALSGGKVRNGSLTGFDLKDNTLSGKQVSESKLGIVPAAARAGSTTGVTVLDTKHLAESPDRASAPQTELAKRGPFTFYAKCYASGGSTVAAIYIGVSNGPFGVFGTDDEDNSGPDGPFTSATPEDQREIQKATAAPNTVASNSSGGVVRVSDGVTTLSGVVGGAFAKNGTITNGDRPFGAGNSCLVGGGALFG